MSRFSRPDRRPMYTQTQDSVMRYAGNTATWRQYVSASAGVAEYGEGSALFYAERTITAVFGRGILGQFLEYQQAAGMEAAGVVPMSSPWKIGRQDEIVWRGVTYRVEADPVPARMLGHWTVQLKRANG